MFWVGIVLYSFVPMREATTPPIVVTTADYILTALCLHGFHPNSMNSVVPGGWTIAVEMTFYFFAPLLFYFITNWQKALTFLLATLLIYLVAVLFLNHIYISHLVWNEVSVSVFNNYAYRWFPRQLPVFACGMLTYFISNSLPRQFFTRQTGLLLLATAIILLQAAIDMGDHGDIPIPQEVYFSIGFSFLFLGLQCHPAKLFVNSFTRLLGKISYSGYLLHFTVLLVTMNLSKILFPELAKHDTMQFLFLFITTVAFTIPVAWLTYRFVESPFISLGLKLVNFSESRN